MQVFKYYFKLALSMRGVIIMFLATFTFAAVAMMAAIPKQTTFTVKKPDVALFNHDNSVFSNGLSDYIKANSEIVDIKDTTEARKEAVYFQKVDAIYIIPENFSAELFAGKKPQIEVTRGTGQGAMQADTLINNYLRLSEPRIIAGMNQNDVVDGVKVDVEKHVTVVTKSADNIGEVGRASFYMNALVYILISLNIVVIGNIMLLFNRDMIRRRNQVSGLKNRKLTAQLLAGNAVFSLGAWAIMVAVGYILFPTAIASTQGILFIIGSAIFSLVSLSIGFLVGMVVKSASAISGITNVTALGMSFLCGVFVPQQFLGESVLNFAHALPAYWYIHANNLIVKLTDYSWESLQPIIFDWAIVLAFAAAIFAFTFIVSKKRSTTI